MKGNAEQNSRIPHIISIYCPNPDISFSPIKFFQCTWPETLIIVIPCLTWHFLYRGKSPRSGCISGYYRTCIWNILLKPWCFNFSRNFWFLTWSYSVIILTMYGHQTLLSWPETRVKIYSWVEIMACHTLQTKQNKNLLVIHFIYKYKPDPTKSQQNRKDRPLV